MVLCANALSQPSIVTEVAGVKIGIIGYITTDTPYISRPDFTLEFLDEIDSVRKEAKKLKSKGIDIIIALGHSGYKECDLDMAKKVPDIDFVVGGHSHSFLYTGSPPSVEEPEGPYPTYVKQKSGKVVPVVQVYCYSKYLGHLKLNFDSEGELMTPVQGVGVSHAEVVMLDHTIPMDPWVDEALDKYRDKMKEYYEVIGSTEVLLKKIEEQESNLGNCIADSMAEAFNDTKIAFENNGGIRASLIPGELTGR